MEAQRGACREDKGQAMRLSSQATSPRSMTAKQRQKKTKQKKTCHSGLVSSGVS